jgi:hypothetical protein
LDGEPNLILEMPGDSLAPVSLSVGLTLLFAAAIFHAWWAVGLGGLVSAASLLDWFWPRRSHVNMDKANG